MNSNDKRFVHRVLITIGLNLAAVLILLLLWYVQQVIYLLFAGSLAAIFLRGVGNRIHRKTRLPLNWCLVLILLVLASLGFLVVFFLGPNIADQMHQFVEKIPGTLQKANEALAHSYWRRFIPMPLSEPGKTAGGLAALAKNATGFVFTTVEVVIAVIVFVFSGLFMAFNPNLYIRGIILLLPPKYRNRGREVIHAIGDKLRWWLVGRFIDMVLVGILSTTGLWLLNVPLALTLGLLAGLLTFIPILGPIASAFPAIMIAFSTSLTQALYVVLLYTGIHVIEGYIATPLIQQRTASLPPLLTLVAVIVMGILSGVLGIILATPITLVALVLIQMLYVDEISSE